MMEMQKNQMDEDSSYQDYLGQKKFTGSSLISPPKASRQRNNYMVNTKSNASKSLFNTTLTSSPSGKRIPNKTIDFSTNQYQMFEANKPNKYSNLKPKLQGRGPGSPTAKYTSPYAQPKKKKIVK